MSEIEPGTREEMYLAAISDQLDGETVDTEHMIEPGSRKEAYLYDIAQKIGSTLELPAVTASDNGDVLTVKNGKWDKGEAPSGLPSVTSSDNGKSLRVVSGDWAADADDFVVTFTKNGSTWSADKNEGDIKSAITAKKRVYGKVSGTLVTTDNAIKMFTLLVPLSGTSNNTGTVFSGTYQSQTNTVTVSFVVYGLATSAYTKTVALSELPPLPSGTDDYKVLTAYDGGWIKAMACITVKYTVTGQPVDGVYPLSASVLLADIQTMLSKGANVCATLTVGGETAILHPASMGTGYVTFSNVVFWDGAWVTFCVTHTNESAQGQIVPISTVQR